MLLFQISSDALMNYVYYNICDKNVMNKQTLFIFVLIVFK